MPWRSDEIPRALPGWLFMVFILCIIVSCLWELKTDSDERRASPGHACDTLPAWGRKP